MSVVADIQELASRALSLFDAGDLPALRTLLEAAAAGEPTPPHEKSAGITDLVGSQRLARTAATCAMGADLSMVFVGSAELVSQFRRSGAITSVHHGVEDQASLYADSWSVFLDAGPLAELKTVFMRHPEQLRPARECLALTAGIPHQIESRPPDEIEPLFRSVQDVWGFDERPHSTRSWLSRLLSVQMARQAGSERATRRLMYWAARSGASQREVADWMGKPQTYVFRQLRAIDLEPSLMALTPREIYEHHVAHEIDRPSLLALLAAYPYEPGSIPENEPYWGYVPGSLDELTQLAAEGRISPQELDVVLAGIEAMAG